MRRTLAAASATLVATSLAMSLGHLDAAAATTPPDHGFGYAITDTASSPPGFCGDTSSDSNSTALALEALNAVRDTSANASAGNYLAAIQNKDGGFAYTTGTSDPDSDAYVIQALVALGVDPATFTNSGKNPLFNLESLQDSVSGGFTYPGSAGPDAFTTSEVPAALALVPYAAATHFVANSSPAGPSPLNASTRAIHARAALKYLYSQQGPDGSVGGAAGVTEDTIIGTADNGFDPATLRTAAGVSAFDYLKAQTVAGLSDNTAGGTAKLILALVAARQDPRTFVPTVDLVAKLNDPAPRGYLQSNGAFHASDATVETANIFSQGLAILADVSVNKLLPKNAVGWIVCAQRNPNDASRPAPSGAPVPTSAPPLAASITVPNTGEHPDLLGGAALLAMGAVLLRIIRRRSPRDRLAR